MGNGGQAATIDREQTIYHVVALDWLGVVDLIEFNRIIAPIVSSDGVAVDASCRMPSPNHVSCETVIAVLYRVHMQSIG